MQTVNGEIVFKSLANLAKSFHDKIKQLDHIDSAGWYRGIEEVESCISAVFGLPEGAWDIKDQTQPIHITLHGFLWGDMSIDECYQEFQAYLCELGDRRLDDNRQAEQP